LWNNIRVSFWRTSDDSIRWLVVIGLMQVLSTVENLYRYGAGNLRWMEPLSLAVTCLAAVPLEEPSRRGLPWQQQLHTPYGLLAGGAFVVSLGLSLWIIIHG
jgi:hypothetical protein